MVLELKACLATFDMDVFCLNVLCITANMSVSLSKLVTSLDHTNSPLSHLMALAKAVALILQWLEAVMHSRTWMSNSHTIYNNYLHFLPMKYPETLVASMA